MRRRHGNDREGPDGDPSESALAPSAEDAAGGKSFKDPFHLVGPWSRRISAVQGAVAAKRHLLDALWLSDKGCELGFSIGINAVIIGFFVGRRLLQVAGELRSLANSSRGSLLTTAAMLAVLGAILGGFAFFGVWLLTVLGDVAQMTIAAVPFVWWILGGSVLVVSLGLMTLVPSEVPYFKVLRFLDEVLWFADVITWASLTLSRKITHVSIRGAGEALGVIGHVGVGTVVKVVRDSATHTLLSPSMISKLGSIGQMFSEYASHTAEDIRLPELALAVAALARLQAVAGRQPAGPVRALQDIECGSDVQRFVWFALGMHGHAGLKFLGAIHYGSVGSDLEALAYCASIPPADVILCEWRGQLHVPGYALAIDHSTQSIVLAIRGSLWPQDWVTDLDCRPRECRLAGQQGFAHAGMLTAAENLSAVLSSVVTSMLSSPSYVGFRLVLTGHSLGAGVAALLAALWAGLSCVAFGMPAVASPHIGRLLTSCILAVVFADDFVPRFSLSSAVRTRDAALRLWRKPGASAATLRRHSTVPYVGDTSDDAVKLRQSAAEELVALMDAEDDRRGELAEELCPLGRVLWALPAGRGGGVIEVADPGAFFRDVPLGSTKDIFEPHLPQNYAARLGGGFGPVPHFP